MNNEPCTCEDNLDECDCVILDIENRTPFVENTDSCSIDDEECISCGS